MYLTLSGTGDIWDIHVGTAPTQGTDPVPEQWDWIPPPTPGAHAAQQLHMTDSYNHTSIRCYLGPTGLFQ